MTPSIQRVYGLRPSKPRDYSRMHAMAIHYVIIQYSVKRSGLRKLNTFAPQDLTKLTLGQKSASIESMMFLKENRDASIKGGA
jgi:hypothetical protein